MKHPYTDAHSQVLRHSEVKYTSWYFLSIQVLIMIMTLIHREKKNIHHPAIWIQTGERGRGHRRKFWKARIVVWCQTG